MNAPGRKSLAAGFAALVLAVAIAVIWAFTAQPPNRPSAVVVSTQTFNRPSAVFPAGDLARGKTLSAQCLACHGDVNIVLGQPAFHPPKLRYQRPSSVFYALQDYRDGRRQSDVMAPVARTLSDQDMRDLSAYVTAGPNRRRGAAPGGAEMASSWAHQKVVDLCGLCHGEAGLGVMDGYPALAGQNQDYIEHALLAYRSGARTNPIMHAFARSLAPDEISKMAAYFAAQPGLEPLR
jgi:cytochrome c553